MKSKVLGLSVLALSLLAVSVRIGWFLLRADPAPIATSAWTNQPEPAAGEPIATEVAPPISPALAVAQESATRTSLPSSAATADEVPVLPRMHVFGRIVDERDAPLPDANVCFDSAGDTWAEGVVVPTIELHGERIDAFATKSDVDGKFGFDLPLPSADWVMLFADPDEFHAFERRDFGPAGGRNQERLKVGENDLGTFYLVSTGAVDGFVRAHDGTPVANAEVSIHGAVAGGGVLHDRSKADGTFSVGHVPEGSWTVKVKCDGFQVAERKSVAAQKRAHTRGIDITLEPAASISGIVVDEAGTPIARVRLELWPVHSGYGSSARSAADGTFTASLPQNDSYRFDIDAPGYEHLGGYTSTAYEPGVRNVRLVLKRGEDAEVIVIDAESGAPIERYGIAVSVVEGEGWQRQESLDEPKIEPHPEGRTSVKCKPGKMLARLLAPGHAAMSIPFVASATGAAQTLRVPKGASVSGRVLARDAPAKDARVELAAAWLKRDASLPDEPEEERFFSDNYRQDVIGFAGRARKREVDADGRFSVEDLAAGHYELVVRSAFGAPLVVDPIAITAGQALDLGDLILQPGASIHGRIAVSPGMELGRWELTLDRPWSKERRELESGGSFRFDAIEPGKHVLLARSARSSDEPKSLLEIVLAAGETKDVVLDVAALCPARVSVQVTRDGRSVAGVRVRGSCEATGQEVLIGTETNAQGEVSGECTPCEAVRFTVLSMLDLPLGELSAPEHVVAGARLELSMSITSGDVRLEFPAGFVVPPRSQAFVTIESSGAKRRPALVTLGSANFPMPSAITWTDRVVEIGEIAAGEYTIVARVQQLSEGAGAPLSFSSIGPEYRGTIIVKSGENVGCALAATEQR